MEQRVEQETLAPPIVAVDLFCGAGGLTCGMRNAGIGVAAGVDVDDKCRFPLEHNNPGTHFVRRNIVELDAAEVASWYPDGCVRTMFGCAPCQPFSKYTSRKGEDSRWTLLGEFLRLIKDVKPEIVSMENVPQLMEKQHPAYVGFIEGLRDLGYAVTSAIVRCTDYGVPQTRKRLVVLARTGQDIFMIPPTHPEARTVRDTIGALPALKADARAHESDHLHMSSSLSELNMKRIRATPEGGGWRDWPDALRLECHKRASGQYYGSVYGRMSWDDPAPTMTTQCFGYGNGRFGHPEQNRAISLREAALLQTFPEDYGFTPDGVRPTFAATGRQIGNAVPVALAKAIGDSIVENLRAFPSHGSSES